MNDLQRAELALFSARAAGPGASLEQMKAIAYCMRNRVRQGWHDGQWLTVMEHADEAEAHPIDVRTVLDPGNRNLQRLVSEIDDIYYGAPGGYGATSYAPGQRSGNGGQRVATGTTAQHFPAEGGQLEESLKDACYWAWINRDYTAWFTEHIMDRPEEHPVCTQMGLMIFLK